MIRSDLSEKIAEASFNPKTKRIIRMILHQHLRFRCRRCATFCCKLGGPQLTQKDIERIKKEGYTTKDFVEPLSNREGEAFPVMHGNLKNREDGSCTFLSFDEKEGTHECSIYDVRPALCKLYPFSLERMGPRSFALKLIPCCRGLNVHRGELVDEEFVNNHLLASIFDLIIESNILLNKSVLSIEDFKTEAVMHRADLQK